MKPLKPQHQRFIAHYLQTGNATQSYLKAYPDCSTESASANASRLLNDDRVKQAVQSTVKEEKRSIFASKDSVLSRVEQLIDKAETKEDVQSALRGLEMGSKLAGLYEQTSEGAKYLTFINQLTQVNGTQGQDAIDVGSGDGGE